MSNTPDIETIQNLKVPAIFRRFRRVPFWCSVIVFLIGVLVLFGWSFEIDFLKRIVPGYVFMNPTSAIAFILSSVALFLMQSENVWRIRVAQICAALVTAIGSIKLLAIIGLFDIGIDRIFFANQAFDNVTGQLNQMAPNTALNFLLVGAALLLFNRKLKRDDFFAAQYPAILALLTSFVAIIGYLYGTKSFYIIVSFNPMAIHTAVSFLLLTIGLLLAKPERGVIKEIFSSEIGGKTARMLFPLVVAVPTVLGWLQIKGEIFGIFAPEIGNAVSAVAISVILGSIVLYNARLMNNAAVKLKQTEKALVSSDELLRLLGESEKNYRQLADAMPQIVWTARADGFLDYYNQRWFDYTGMTLEETEGWGWEPVLHPDDLQNCIDVWSEAVRTGEKYRVEYRFRQAGNGEFRWHLGQALPVRNAEGEIVKWFGTCTDIHEQKGVEEELRHIQEELESRVEQRTVALERGNIDLSNQIAERQHAESRTQVIFEIIQGAATASNLNELLALVHQSISRTIYAENFYVALYDEQSEILHIPFCEDKFDAVSPPQKLGKGLTAYIFRLARPMFLTKNDIYQLIERGEVELVGTPPAVWLGVPLRTPTGVIGVLVVQHYENENAYTERDIQLLSSVGDQIAVVIERKRAEEAVQNSRDYLDRIINAVPDPIFVKNRRHEFTIINDAMSKFMGRSREELIGKSDYDFVPAEEAAIFWEKDELVFTSTKECVNEERLTDAHGDTRIINTVRRLHIDKDGEQFIVAVIHDITANKLFEEVLKTGETVQRQLAEQQSAILDALPAHICLLDQSGIILEVNNEWKQFAIGNGYKELNFGVGSNYLEICQNACGDFAEDASLVAEQCRAVLSGESSYFELEQPCFSPTEKLWFKLTITPINKEKTAGVVIMHVNITERKRIEEELEQTRDAALESVRLKSEFLANMSHEIRTPMNGVIGMTGLLLDTNLNEEQQDYAKTVQSSADGLLRIIDDILDFSKIEAGKLHFERIDFDLRECVESAVETLAERAQTKGIEIASLVYRDVPTLLCGDPGRLRQILTNLIGNAVKFTEKGEVAVNVRRECDAGIYTTLRFEITDTGIGISKEAQRQLFHAFVQADGSTTRKYGGTGLGLAISKQLVEMMGGEIGIESEPGKGSTFWFTARFEKQPKQIPRIKTIADVILEGVRVLIVDDNETNRKIFLHQTVSWGMIPTEVESGEKALEIMRAAAVRNEPFEIAILDLMMPEMDGFELARHIKADPILSKTHLLLLPSYGKRGDGQTAREFGIAAYIQKPVRQSQLYNCLITVIAESSVEIDDDKQRTAQLITQHSLRTLTKADSESAAMSKVRILVAEDNLVNQKVALSQLKSLGYAADVAKNGREAVEAVKKYEYDVVLMDCQMPEMDGFEATAAIRSFEGDISRTTIIAMTAHALEGEREKCIAAGMDDYISKPVNMGKLKETLERWLKPISVAESDAQTESANVARKNKKHQSVDSSVLNSFRDLQQSDEPDVVTELIDLFLPDAEKRIAILKNAIANQEIAEMKAQAHGIKGSSGNIGAKYLEILSEKLEEQDITAAEMQMLITEIEDEFEDVARILTGMRLESQFIQ